MAANLCFSLLWSRGDLAAFELTVPTLMHFLGVATKKSFNGLSHGWRRVLLTQPMRRCSRHHNSNFALFCSCSTSSKIDSRDYVWETPMHMVFIVLLHWPSYLLFPSVFDEADCGCCFYMDWVQYCCCFLCFAKANFSMMHCSSPERIDQCIVFFLTTWFGTFGSTLWKRFSFHNSSIGSYEEYENSYFSVDSFLPQYLTANRAPSYASSTCSPCDSLLVVLKKT